MTPKLLTLNNIGLKGLNTDIQAWELSPEYITHGMNYRVISGAIEASGGSSDWSTVGVNFNPGFELAKYLSRNFLRSTTVAWSSSLKAAVPEGLLTMYFAKP